MTVRLYVRLDRLPQTNERADRIQDERYARNSGNDKGLGNHRATKEGRAPDGIIHIAPLT
jgi:hypothetical protein